MKPWLLLLWLAGALDPGLFELALPAPRNLTVFSVNFKHELRWTEAPGSPPGLKYHVRVTEYSCYKKRNKGFSTKNLWADVILEEPTESYNVCVRSSFKGNKSSWARKDFTPYLDTTITAPVVTLAGCGKCIQINISLPMDIRKIYKGLLYKVSWRQKQEEAVQSIETENQTVVISHLLKGTEYCVQVQPSYLVSKNFQPSSWECVFTSPVQPSQVPAVVGSVAAFVVLSLSALILLLFFLQYTGIICKLKEALPHTLSASSRQRCLLKLEETTPEPLFLLPESERQQHSPCDPEEADLETDELDQIEDQEEGLYMDRCADLSSDSSSKCSPITSSFQSAATVIDQPGSLNTMIERQPDEQAEVLKNPDCMKRESKDCTEIEDWQKELEKYEGVNLFSVTTTALDLQSDQKPFEVQPLEQEPTLEQSDIDQEQPVQEDDSADQQTQMNYYMRH